MEKPTSAKESDSPPRNVRIKQEPSEDGDNMKDFAENTMNELLGWYGYDKVETEDTEKLTLQRYAGQRSEGQRSQSTPPSETGSDVPYRETVSNGSAESSVRITPSPGSGSDLAAHHQALVSALNGASKSSNPSSAAGAGEGSLAAGYIVCAWCQKTGLKLFTLKSGNTTKAFCSELCFTQCRRASFKKNKVCDWCKHVRHTVNYVDFQDGEQQLQFCSAKCLNQYKMNIFCKETQEHLQQIQSGAGGGQASTSSGGESAAGAAVLTTPPPSVTPNSSQILITPDLWMQKGGSADHHKAKQRMESPTDEDIKPIMLDAEDEEDANQDMKAISNYAESKDRVKRTFNSSRERLNQKRSRVNSFIEQRHLEFHEKMKHRSRSRDYSSTPMSVAPSPTSSHFSTSPSIPTTISPPVNGPSPSVPGVSTLGVDPAALAAQPAMLYRHLLASGLPGLPPQMMIPPEEHRRLMRSHERNATVGSNAGNHGGPGPEGGSEGNAAFMNHSPPQPGLQPPPLGFYPPPPGMIPMGMPPHMLPGHPMASVLPPSTLLQPYPVFIPLPVPVPIVIPVKTDKDLHTLLNMYKTQPKTEKEDNVSERSDSVHHDAQRSHSPKDSEVSVLDVSADNGAMDCSTSTMETIQCACCQQQSRHDVHNSECNNSKQSYPTPDSKESHAYQRNGLLPKNECGASTSSSDYEDIAMDLTKDKHERSQDTVTTVEPSKATPIMIKPTNMANESPVPPLVPMFSSVGGHLLPPRDHSYSSRRGLILDAPSVPRDRSSSPSSEKRILLRGPSRDMHFAKRRCLRRGVKTK